MVNSVNMANDGDLKLINHFTVGWISYADANHNANFNNLFNEKSMGTITCGFMSTHFTFKYIRYYYG